MRFGEAIRELRPKRQLSQRQLAPTVGVTCTYVSKIENHKLDFGELIGILNFQPFKWLYPSEARQIKGKQPQERHGGPGAVACGVFRSI